MPTQFDYQATLLASFTVQATTRKAAEARLREALSHGTVTYGPDAAGWSQQTGIDVEGDLDLDGSESLAGDRYTFDATLIANFTLFDETAKAAETRLRAGLEDKAIEVEWSPNGLTFSRPFDIEGEIDLQNEQPVNEAAALLDIAGQLGAARPRSAATEFLVEVRPLVAVEAMHPGDLTADGECKVDGFYAVGLTGEIGDEPETLVESLFAEKVTFAWPNDFEVRVHRREQVPAMDADLICDIGAFDAPTVREALEAGVEDPEYALAP